MFFTRENPDDETSPSRLKVRLTFQWGKGSRARDPPTPAWSAGRRLLAPAAAGFLPGPARPVVPPATYRHQHAVQVRGLRGALAGRRAGVRPKQQQLGQPAWVADAQDVDVVLAAKRLDQGEVDLQSHVPVVVLIRRQQAQHHVIRIPTGGEGGSAQDGERTGTFELPAWVPDLPIPTPTPPWGQMAGGRQQHRRARGARERDPSGLERAKDPDLHVEQLGRLVHPNGDGALTQGFAQHLLQGIPYLVHPTGGQEREDMSACDLGAVVAPSSSKC